MKLRGHSQCVALQPNRAFWGLLVRASVLAIMPSIALGQTAVQRDQQALAILSQTLSAGGGQNLIIAIQDLTETGTVNLYLDQEFTASITVKERGLHQFRMDVLLPEGQRSTVVNGASGSLTEANGQFRSIYQQSIADLWSMTFPYLPVLAAIQDSTNNITYRGLVTHNGASVYDIRIEKTYTPQQDPTGTRGAQEGHDVYIDPNSFVVISILDQIHFGEPGADGLPHEILYSNYETESGLAMPMTISETLGGVTGVTMQLNQVTFNSGLSDSDFGQ